MNYKEEIEQLEKDCTLGFDDAIHNYLLMDIEESGELKQLFTDEDLYFFWLEKGYRINLILENLLYSPEQKDLALKAIKIKRITDSNLLKYGKSEKEILEDLTLEETKGSSEIIDIKYQGENKEKFLNAFYKQLIEDGYIDCSFEIFSSNFIRSKNVKRIDWRSTQKDLLTLIKLINKVINLKKRTLTKLILDHFLIDGNKPNQGSIEFTLPNLDIDHPKFKKYSEMLSQFLI